MAIETIAKYATMFSGVAGAAGSIQQGFAAREMAEYNARAAEANAQAARQQAALDEAMSRKKSSLAIGAIRARAAANAGDIGGSALDILADSAEQAELEALVLRYGGEVKARAAESEARLQRLRGRNAVMEGFTGAGTALLKAGEKFQKAYGGAGEDKSVIPDVTPPAKRRNAFGGRYGTGV